MAVVSVFSLSSHAMKLALPTCTYFKISIKLVRHSHSFTDRRSAASYEKQKGESDQNLVNIFACLFHFTLHNQFVSFRFYLHCLLLLYMEGLQLLQHNCHILCKCFAKHDFDNNRIIIKSLPKVIISIFVSLLNVHVHKLVSTCLTVSTSLTF